MIERWQVIVDRDPEKILRKVDTELRKRLLARLHDLEIDPKPHGVTKLEGYKDLYRVRVGDWRIIYAIKEEQLIVLVIEIAPRGGAYARL